MSTVHPQAREDADRLFAIADQLTYTRSEAETVAKASLFEIATRMAAGMYAAPCKPAEPQPCACVPGTCRGGDVVAGRLPNGWRCRAWSTAVPAHCSGPDTEGQMGF